MRLKEKKIGGFFELEIPNANNEWHEQAILLSTGRACFRAILQELKPKKIYIPFYACKATYEPLLNSEIDFEYYQIDNQLQPKTLPSLDENSCFFYINYFGIKSDYLLLLERVYGHQLIIDNTQAFYEQNYTQCWSFNSARKFFGVPDGAYLYSPELFELDNIESKKNENYQYLFDRLIGKIDCAYQGFLENEKILNSTINKPSDLSVKLLSSIDYGQCKQRRNENFRLMHGFFGKFNQLVINQENIDGPMCYPLLVEQNVDKKLFHEKGYFIPTYWNDVLEHSDEGFTFEKDLCSRLIPLPIDQRYSKTDLMPLIQYVLALL